MRVPGDIIAGTDGKDVASSWTERFNSKGLEAHTPGDYACLNRNIFTTELEGRQSTRMPHRWSVSVRYTGDGGDQPDHKTATKIIELLRAKTSERFFLAAGFVRPHYPMVAPEQFFEPYRWKTSSCPPSSTATSTTSRPKARPAAAPRRTASPNTPRTAAHVGRVLRGRRLHGAQVGRILDELDRLGLRETTAIVFTSDTATTSGAHVLAEEQPARAGHPGCH